MKHVRKHPKKGAVEGGQASTKPLDWKGLAKKYILNETVLIILLILFSIGVSTHYRMYSSHLDVTEQWAWDTYRNQIRGTVSQQVASQYPNLPEAQRNEFINEQVDDIIKEQQDQLEPQIKETAEFFKSRLQDENGNTYLLAIDPYVWLTQAENYVKNGHPGDSLVEGEASIDRRNGREPSITRFSFHPWIGAQIYKIVSVFDKNFTVQRSMFLLPVIIIALSIIPAFFIGRKIGGNLSGFLSGLLVAINISLLTRTPAGFSDTDPYIIFFPLFIVWTFMESITTHNVKKRYAWAVATIIGIVFFRYTWGSYWHIVGVLLAVSAAYFIFKILTEWKQYKKFDMKQIQKTRSYQTAILVIVVLLGTVLFNALVTGLTNSGDPFFSPLAELVTAPFGALNVKSVASTDIWPNVLTTVAELNAGSWRQIINSVGGKLFFYIGILGVLLTFLKKDQDGRFEIRYIALLGIWFFGLSLAAIMSSRFTALLAAPFAIAFGSAFGMLFTLGGTYAKTKLKINPWIPKIIIIVILAFVLSDSFAQAKQVAVREIPSMTDTWYDSLTAIKNDSEDAIITSWWDFGHWFVNVAERRVTFDGGGQGRRIHWVGKSLMTPDVEENKQILRMLNCGQETGYNRIVETLENDHITSTHIITTITYQSRAEAAETLIENGIPFDKVDYILEKTHCSDEELIDQYYIVSQDMIGKAGVWAHFGSWNFTRATIYNTANNNDFETAVQKIEELGFSTEEAEQFYFDAISLTTSRQVDTWISPWPAYITTTPRPCQTDNNTVLCNIQQGLGSQQGGQVVLNQAIIDLNSPTNSQFSIAVVANGQVVGTEFVTPSIVSIDNGEEIVSYKLDSSSSFPYEIVIVEIEGGYRAMIADPLLARSAFTMLYYFNGKYMDGYEKIFDENTFTGQKIAVYRVDLDNLFS